jgi:ABC-2 type transport system permease protein
MNLRRLRAVTRKEFLHVFRDPRSLGMAVAIPMIMLVIFGYALTLDVDKVPLVVWDQSQSHASRELISRFTGSRYFSLVGQVQDYDSIVEMIDTRRAMVALIVPPQFPAMVETGRTAAVQCIVDGSDSNTATLAINYAVAVTGKYSQELNIRQLQRAGGPRVDTPLELRPRVWFNADLESKNYIVPGLVAVIMMVIAALLTSLTVAREWEQGTMEQLIATPVKGPELVIGKLIPYFVVGMVDVALAVGMGRFVFGVPLRGSVLLLFGVSAIFMAGVQAMGLLISIVMKSQLLAAQVAMVATFLPAFLLSGFIFAIPNMPRAVQAVTYFVPARYFVSLLKGIYLKGVGLEVLMPETLLLTAFSVAMLFLANWKFKKKLV